MFRHPAFNPLCQVAQRRIEGISNLPQTANGGVKDSSLNPTDVCPIEAAIAAEAFLRVTGSFAKFAHDSPYGSGPQICRLDLPLAPSLHRQIRW